MAAKGQYKTDKEREEWLGVMRPAFMSSDSSGEDDGEEVIIIHPLAWISSDVTLFKSKLDEEIRKEKSPQAHRQMKHRVVGSLSTRPCPTHHDFPSWTIVE